MTLNTVEYDKLLSGPADYPQAVPVGAAQDIKRGDLLEADPAKGSAAVFTRPAGAAVSGMVHCVATDDVQTAAGVTAVLPAYFAGYFNPDVMRFGGASTPADNAPALMLSHIFLRAVVDAQPTA